MEFLDFIALSYWLTLVCFISTVLIIICYSASKIFVKYRTRTSEIRQTELDIGLTSEGTYINGRHSPAPSTVAV